MKKLLLLSTIGFLMVLNSAIAQKQFYIGVGGAFLTTGMTNQNNFGLEDNMDWKPTIGSILNANIGYDFNDHIGLKLELGYSMLGQKSENLVGSTTVKRKISLNYFQIPLLFKYRSSGKSAKFFLAVGPQFDLLLSGKQTFDPSVSMYNDSLVNPLTNKKFKISDEDVKERYSSLEIMGRLDLGVEIIVSKNLFIDVALTMAYGLMDINSTDWRIPDYATPPATGKYNASHIGYAGINLGLNYTIPFGK